MFDSRNPEKTPSQAKTSDPAAVEALKICSSCQAMLVAAQRDFLVEREGGYTLVRHVVTWVCPACGKSEPIPAERLELDTSLGEDETARSTWVSPDDRPDLGRSVEAPTRTYAFPEARYRVWTAERALALVGLFAYLSFSLVAANDGRMFRVAAYAVAALTLVWFSGHINQRLNVPRWTGAAMGWFLFVFPAFCFLVVAVLDAFK